MSKYLEKALELAKKAYEENEVPIGCVIVKDDKIVGSGYNKREKLNNSLMHAEIIAIDEACKTLNSWRLVDCDIYITLEPCIMCSGAILQSRLKNVYIGSLDSKNGCAISNLQILDNNDFNHKCKVHYIENVECSNILSNFFKELRLKKSNKL